MLTLFPAFAALALPLAIVLILIKAASHSPINRPRRTPARPLPWTPAPTYQAQPLLSPAEHRFYHALRQAVGRDAKIMVKVRLADLVRLQTFSWQAFQPLAMKHVDFVLCAPMSLAVLGVVELDDRSHQEPSRRDRDRFVDAVLAQARVPVLHVPVVAAYDPEGLRAILAPLWGGLARAPHTRAA